MKLPADYPDVVRAGAAALQALGSSLRNAAAADADAPELWLSIRDVEGLAGRLLESTDWEWRHGAADVFLSPQDLGVLNELLVLQSIGPVGLGGDDLTALARMRDFLRQYSAGGFALEDPYA